MTGRRSVGAHDESALCAQAREKRADEEVERESCEDEPEADGDEWEVRDAGAFDDGARAEECAERNRDEGHGDGERGVARFAAERCQQTFEERSAEPLPHVRLGNAAQHPRVRAAPVQKMDRANYEQS